MAHPSITTASPVPLDGLVTSTWSLRLRMDFNLEILSSPLFPSKMEVGTAASSYFNTSFRLIALIQSSLAITLSPGGIFWDRGISEARYRFCRQGFYFFNLVYIF